MSCSSSLFFFLINEISRFEDLQLLEDHYVFQLLTDGNTAALSNLQRMSTMVQHRYIKACTGVDQNNCFVLRLLWVLCDQSGPTRQSATVSKRIPTVTTDWLQNLGAHLFSIILVFVFAASRHSIHWKSKANQGWSSEWAFSQQKLLEAGNGQSNASVCTRLPMSFYASHREQSYIVMALNDVQYSRRKCFAAMRSIARKLPWSAHFTGLQTRDSAAS